MIVQEGDFLTSVSLSCVPCRGKKRETDLMLEARRQLGEYFARMRQKFALPVKPKGTEFQKCVWNELEHIPYGSAVSYGELAKKTGNANAARAVGGACNKNPVCIIIPCHRVVGSDGSLTGYAYGVDFKRRLLELEGATI